MDFFNGTRYATAQNIYDEAIRSRSQFLMALAKAMQKVSQDAAEGTPVTGYPDWVVKARPEKTEIDFRHITGL